MTNTYLENTFKKITAEPAITRNENSIDFPSKVDILHRFYLLPLILINKNGSSHFPLLQRRPRTLIIKPALPQKEKNYEVPLPRSRKPTRTNHHHIIPRQYPLHQVDLTHQIIPLVTRIPNHSR